MQLIVNAKNLDVICLTVAPGHVHDFQMFKDCGIYIPEYIQMILDMGYTGMFMLHKNTLLPIRSSKKHKLTKEEKKFNRWIASQRISIEHVNRYIKRFRIFSGKYRNRRSRFALRFALVCGIYNRQH